MRRSSWLLDRARSVAAAAFFVDYFETALADDEMVVEVRLPIAGAEGWSYQKFAARANDWAIVAVAVAGTRIAMAGMGPVPIRAHAAEEVLATGGDIAAAAELAADGTHPVSDAHADAAYRRHLGRVLTERALKDAQHR